MNHEDGEYQDLDATRPPDGQRRAALFEVSADFLRSFILSQTDFLERYPGADHLAVHYDFNSNCFWFKFRHPSLPIVAEGEVHPRIPPPLFRAPA